MKHEFNSWTDAYSTFIAISDTVLDTGINHDTAHIIINKCVDTMYATHKGEPVWDEAYRRWTTD